MIYFGGIDWIVESSGISKNRLNGGTWWNFLTEWWNLVEMIYFGGIDWIVESGGISKNWLNGGTWWNFWLNGGIWWNLTEWRNLVEFDWMVESGGIWLNGGIWWSLTEWWNLVEFDWIVKSGGYSGLVRWGLKFEYTSRWKYYIVSLLWHLGGHPRSVIDFNFKLWNTLLVQV